MKPKVSTVRNGMFAFMNAKALMAVLLMSTAAFSAVAQTNIAPAAMNWGETICGAALSTGLSNEAIPSGTTVTLNCWIKNDSTNLVVGSSSTASLDFLVILSDNSGLLRQLTDDPYKVYPNNFQRGSYLGGLIMPKQTNSCKISLKFDKDIKPGNYKLVTKRRFIIEGKPRELVSNTLKIKVVNGSVSVSVPTIDSKGEIAH
jgi:hypothetical protein